jgi:hypothetical protein
MPVEDVVELSSQDPDADGDVQHHTFRLGRESEASTVVTQPGRGPAIAELEASTAAAGPGRVSGATCGPGELGRMGRGPAAG